MGLTFEDFSKATECVYGLVVSMIQSELGHMAFSFSWKMFVPQPLRSHSG